MWSGTNKSMLTEENEKIYIEGAFIMEANIQIYQCRLIVCELQILISFIHLL